jgi:hydroxymethylpyrimidine pyrophosphatase-like HAD family hydrolase
VVPPIQLIALDLDGTLLDPSEAISPANRAAIAQARALGVRVVLVTGRGSDIPLALARNLGLSDPLICAHGALTKDVCTGHDLARIAIPREFAAPMIGFAQQHRLDCAVYVDERFHRLAGGQRYMDDMQGPNWIDVPSLLELADREPTFIRFFGTACVDAINARFAGMAVHFKYETWGSFEELAITSEEATKVHALDRLCRTLNVDARTVLAIGDSRNDVPMLRWAGIGVAMANALPEVIEAVDYVTGRNDEDGVATALERFVLGPAQREERSA